MALRKHTHTANEQYHLEFYVLLSILKKCFRLQAQFIVNKAGRAFKRSILQSLIFGVKQSIDQALNYYISMMCNFKSTHSSFFKLRKNPWGIKAQSVRKEIKNTHTHTYDMNIQQEIEQYSKTNYYCICLCSVQQSHCNMLKNS